MPYSRKDNRPGIVLLITLMMLVILASVAYLLSARVLAYRHRTEFRINYAQARYACDSAVKYAMYYIEDNNIPPLSVRADIPDFSDVFAMDQEYYSEFIGAWIEQVQQGESFMAAGDVNDSNMPASASAAMIIPEDPNNYIVPGPYGPRWPYIFEPMVFEIGSASVRVEIEDENAKYPLLWSLLEDNDISREAEMSLDVFCQWCWRDVNDVIENTDILKEDIKQVGEIKKYLMDFSKAVMFTQRTDIAPGAVGSQSVVDTKISPLRHSKDFAELLYSSLMDMDMLTRTVIETEVRKEYPLKYISLWAPGKVNINTAPRHVLEAAFVFGGDYLEIAEEIIKRRRIQPFKDIEALKQDLLKYSDSIKKSESFITTQSELFTLKVTATAGVANASAVVAYKKNGEKMEKIGIIAN